MHTPFTKADTLVIGILTGLFSLGFEGLNTIEPMAASAWSAPLFGGASAVLALGALTLWRRLYR